jgi:urate oxidase
VTLAHNSYGKAEIHLVHLDRGADEHRVTDLTVTVDLEGDFEAAHLEGDNTGLVATDSQKNIVYGLARSEPPGPPESFALRVAGYLAAEYASVTRARVDVEAVAWLPVEVGERSFPDAFHRDGGRRRVARAVVTDRGDRHVLGGLDGLALLKSSNSSFRGFLRDRWTTLPETDDRILASSVRARWRFAELEVDFDEQHERASDAMVGTFARHRSESLQQTLHAMGEALLEACPAVAEVRLSLPNLHHFLVDLSGVGLDNPNLVFHADDRPYGLIEGVLVRPGAPPAGSAWQGPLLT